MAIILTEDQRWFLLIAEFGEDPDLFELVHKDKRNADLDQNKRLNTIYFNKDMIISYIDSNVPDDLKSKKFVIKKPALINTLKLFWEDLNGDGIEFPEEDMIGGGGSF